MDDSTKEKLIDEMKLTLNRFYAILEDTPQISGEHQGNKNSFTCGDIVELIFGNEEVRLTTEGRIYDYIVLAPEEYKAPTTKEQINSIIEEKGKQPSFIKYTRRSMIYDSEKSPTEFCQDFKIELSFLDEEVQKRLKTQK